MDQSTVKMVTDSILEGTDVRTAISEANIDRLRHAIEGWTAEEGGWKTIKSGNALTLVDFPFRDIDDISINLNLTGDVVEIHGHFEAENDSHELISASEKVSFTKDELFNGIKKVYNQLAQEYYSLKEI